MSRETELSAAAQQYAKAHASHYTERNWLAALRSYEDIITYHPSSREAGYARTQIRNIVTLVLPAEELLSAELALVRHHLQPERAESMAPLSP